MALCTSAEAGRSSSHQWRTTPIRSPFNSGSECGAIVWDVASRLPASLGIEARYGLQDKAQSSTERASGPQWSKVYELGMTPLRLTRPKVGLKPTTPHNEAGARIEPPVSEPSAIGTNPAATAAPEPLDEPTGETRQMPWIACRRPRQIK